MDKAARYDSWMADDLSKMLQEIMDLTGVKQAALGKLIGVAQSTINRWLKEQNEPSAAKVEKVKEAWRKAKGYKTLSVDQKIAPYDEGVRETIHTMVDNYLRMIGPPTRR